MARIRQFTDIIAQKSVFKTAARIPDSLAAKLVQLIHIIHPKTVNLAQMLLDPQPQAFLHVLPLFVTRRPLQTGKSTDTQN